MSEFATVVPSSSVEDSSSDSDRERKSRGKNRGNLSDLRASMMSCDSQKTRARGASISEQGKMRRKYKRSMSANAGMLQPALTENLRSILTKERVPHMDHYRQSIDHRKFIFFAHFVRNLF